MTASTLVLPVLPLRNLVLFPGVVMPVDVGRPSSLRLVDDMVGRGAQARIVVSTQKDPQKEDPGPEDLQPIGLEVEILKVIKLADTRITVVLRGLQRVRLVEVTTRLPYLHALIEPLADQIHDPVEVEGLAMAVREAAKQMVELSPEIPDESQTVFDQIQEPGRLADMAAANLDVPAADRLALLAATGLKKR